MKSFYLLLTLTVTVWAAVDVELPFKDGFDSIWAFEVDTSNTTSGCKHHGKVYLRKTGNVIQMVLRDFKVDKVTNVQNVNEIEERAKTSYLWKYTEPQPEYFYNWELDALDITELFWYGKKDLFTTIEGTGSDGVKNCVYNKEGVADATAKSEVHIKLDLTSCSSEKYLKFHDKDEKVVGGKIDTILTYIDGTIKKIESVEEIKSNKNTNTWKGKVTFEDFIAIK